MSDPAEQKSMPTVSLRLADAIREVKNAAADREDVVVELREAQKMRLELLAAELAPIFADVPGRCRLRLRDLVGNAAATCGSTR